MADNHPYHIHPHHWRGVHPVSTNHPQCRCCHGRCWNWWCTDAHHSLTQHHHGRHQCGDAHKCGHAHKSSHRQPAGNTVFCYQPSGGWDDWGCDTKPGSHFSNVHSAISSNHDSCRALLVHTHTHTYLLHLSSPKPSLQ